MKQPHHASIISVAGAILCAMMLAACSNNDLWPTATVESFPDKIALKTDYTVTHLGGYDFYDAKFSAGFAGDRFFRISPAISQNKVYVLSDKGDVTQLNAQTGKINWHTHHPHAAYSTTPAISDHTLIAGTNGGMLQAMDPHDGHVLWEKQLDAGIVAPASLTANEAIVRTQNDTVYAISLKNGHVVWQHHEDTGDIVMHVNSPPTIVDQYVFVGLSQGQLVILSLKEGRLLARHVLFRAHDDSIIGRMPDIVAQPLIDGYTAFVGSAHGGLLAFDLHTGQTLWRNITDTVQNIALDAQQLYVSTTDSRVLAFNRKTGTQLWEQKMLMGRQISAPVLMDHTVVVGDRYGHALWLSQKDGKPLAFKAIHGSSLASPPVAINDSVYFYSLWGALVKLSLSTTPIEQS